MKTSNMIALAILGGQLASAGWIGVAGCDRGTYQGVSSSQSCATAFWMDYVGWQYDPDSGEMTGVTYPVLVQEEMSFRSSGFSTLSVHQRNQPVGVFELPHYQGLNFSYLSASFWEVIRIYGPGVPGDYWVEVDWRLDHSGIGEYDFHTGARLEGNELLLSADLNVDSFYLYPYPQNQDLKLWIERIRLIDQRTGAPLTGYYYSAGPEPGVMVGGTLWTPEPATVGLAASALFTLALWRRRNGC